MVEKRSGNLLMIDVEARAQTKIELADALVRPWVILKVVVDKRDVKILKRRAILAAATANSPVLCSAI